MVQRHPGAFRFLDRYHSSELRPEETNGDGTHYGGGHGNRILNTSIAALRSGMLCEGNTKARYGCRFEKRCACSLDGKDIDELWRYRKHGRAFLSSWSFGEMVYERQVVLTHAHMLLNLVLQSRRHRGSRAHVRGKTNLSLRSHAADFHPPAPPE
jgi:hypothetical protein